MNTVWLIISSVVVYLFYLKFIKPSFYWKQRGVFHVNPYSRLIRVFFSDKTFLDIIRNAYEEFPCKRYYGSFQFLRPSLLVRDLELAKKITIKDFDHFHDHFTLANDNDLVLSSNLFALKGEKWRDMRSTLSPAFSSSKMKQMFVLMTETAESFTDYLVASSENKPREYETKDLFTKYTNDVIASCAFGIKCDSLREDKNEFYKMGQNISNTFKRILSLKGLLNVFFPKLCQALGVGVFDDAVTRFFKRIVVDTISVREKGDVVRPDMIHLLMEARKGRLKYDGADIGTSGFATVDESNLMQSAKRKIDLTDDVITAQALIFFIAGFETSSTLLSFLSYELALNPAIQKHLQDEIDETMKLNGGQIKYDELLKMKYVDQVISETLRKYPPALALNRICTKDYLIPAQLARETDLLLEKGCLVAIPVYGFHMDPKYFPEPDKFDPERFNEENKQRIVSGSYLPFGSGPRNCIGSRFALLESKVVIVNLLSKFNIVRTEKTQVPLQMARSAFISAKGGVWVALQKR